MITRIQKEHSQKPKKNSQKAEKSQTTNSNPLLEMNNLARMREEAKRISKKNQIKEQLDVLLDNE